MRLILTSKRENPNKSVVASVSHPCTLHPGTDLLAPVIGWVGVQSVISLGCALSSLDVCVKRLSIVYCVICV